ncbi:hypothetical protein [Arthrobacter sp. TMN-50]
MQKEILTLSEEKIYVLKQYVYEEIQLETGGMQGSLHFAVELDSPLEAIDRSVLVRFELGHPLQSLAGTGLMQSSNPRAGYFCYLETKLGSHTAQLSITLPSDTTCLKVVLVPWSPSAVNVFARKAVLKQSDVHVPMPEKPLPFKSFRNLGRFDCAIFEYPTIEGFFLSKSLEPGLHVIRSNDLPLEIMYKPQGAAVTSVVFNAALNSSTQEIPRFMASPLFAELEVNGIFVFDASLHLDDSLMLAWYAGSALFPLQKELPAILQKFVADAGGVRTLLFGASGGGFAAAYYAQFFKASVAIIANPQIIVANYIPRIVDSFAKICWNAQNTQNILEALNTKMVSDLRELPMADKLFTIVYLQNISDDHVDKHLVPFCEAFPGNSAIHLIMDNWGSGHVSPPRKLVSAILSTIIKNPSNWEHMLQEFDSINGPTSHSVRARIASVESGLECPEKKEN